MPFDALPEVEMIDRSEYDAHWAERAVSEYIQGRRREDQRRILNAWLRKFGFYVVSYRNWRGEAYS